MTLQELYQNIGAEYDQAMRVLRMEKLLDKHIRKLTNNGVVEQLLAAGETMDPTQLFETAHAAKGVCSNLGLTGLASLASDIAEESFVLSRPRKSASSRHSLIAASLSADFTASSAAIFASPSET